MLHSPFVLLCLCAKLWNVTVTVTVSHVTVINFELFGQTQVVYHLLGKTSWLIVLVHGTCRILNGNFHRDVFVPFPKLFLSEDRIKGNPSQKAWN